MSLDDWKAKFAGKRVKYVGMSGKTDGPVGRVWRVTSLGVWVTWENGERQQCHPEGLRVID
ncbi:hypothetical protein RI444_07605 [Paenarthrobacter sp. AT5]|uniref:hypothetical protein n=1 Tax=Paenarthrobacter TaxID=1742992 RepID=UPI001A99BCAD|nr:MULTISPECIES: hypothetical protein [Paenarthrobacter]QSZ54503.1 hypothetical protein AYX19_16955 [Paenarthrobacter ureafaciens]WOC62476.1 hypothetical protein RI444_07605 [Paenarthrobacter sp. AT5]